ncbi:hypothetical protein P175DRAFT_0505136 [Aspergillus ochraceoroseus IBT 24754]|uniref:Ca2+-modulated nonselective cation channel polycystin n=3 Tax=Aspergillus subgen. Nidulantes TaxID=2720870 RepID=A0A0F8XNJ7_9EURO|nr:uncharacterized protein P175DRAFT_0505136 [Aspergillus ochraceoroseus IBT 24754]KKK21888.1 hypothetical protein AOCH_006105 [Aspergillus ochraceoroseus]KKK25082.1 hypothetical protein ARAM_007070 [Aspergillus rambellii]PTU17371.1 hypothetical protein P175DRAFT_0505136 [Aspergillus ochraceoroseus IBT 24754]
MATTEGPAQAHDRHGRRRPFSSWMKRLANLKSSNDSGTIRWSNKRHAMHKSKSRGVKNNPYPLSGTNYTTHQYSSDQISSDMSDGHGPQSRSRSQSEPSVSYSGYDNQILATSAKSTAPTISTNGDTTISEAAYSKAGTMATVGGGISSRGGGEGSTFSSPAPSVRSLTTTLTTVQSAAPSSQIYNAHNHAHYGHHHGHSIGNPGAQQVQFSHQFPPSPATAVPAHLAPHGHSVTYSTATANNILTDNASILTLASSSKRRRRNSLDTNASIRALAPSSVFGGSRESLPLSVLSATVGEPSNTPALSAQGVLNRPSLVGLASVERVSVYSSAGPVPGGERGSLQANKQSAATGDGASIRSGVHSHVRQDSNAASISGAGGQSIGPGRISRRSSGWGEIITGEESDVEKIED